MENNLQSNIAMKNLLVTLDLKPSDSLLLDQASMIAEKFKSKIWMVHIASTDPEFIGYDMGPMYIRDFLAEELRTEHRQLQSYAEELHKRSIVAEGLLIEGPTKEMILNEVTKLHIDLLIIGSHKHGFLYETFVGHTAVKMIGSLRIPLMIVPLPEEK